MFASSLRAAPALLARMGATTAARMPAMAARTGSVAASAWTGAATAVSSATTRACSQYVEESIFYPPAETRVAQPAPMFKAPAVINGEISELNLEDYRGKWVVLFFYPKDFTFVCPTEIIAYSERSPEFDAINTQVIGCSTDTQETHLAWIRTPRKMGGLGRMRIPLVADTTKVISARYGALMEELGIAARGLYIIDPEGVLQQITVNNLPVGRSVDETLRLVQAFQFVAEHGEVCPAGWKPGSKTMIADPDASLEYFENAESSIADSAVTSVTSRAEYDEKIASGKVVVDFYAPWCSKCSMIAPFYEELAEKHTDITFLQVDTDDEAFADLVDELALKGLPSFKLFNNGVQVGKDILGYKKRPLEEAVEAL